MAHHSFANCPFAVRCSFHRAAPFLPLGSPVNVGLQLRINLILPAGANAYMPGAIVLRDILPLGKTEQLGSNDMGTGEKIKMAEAIKYPVIVLSSAPVLAIYPFVQKYLVQGVGIGALKGCPGRPTEIRKRSDESQYRRDRPPPRGPQHSAARRFFTLRG